MSDKRSHMAKSRDAWWCDGTPRADQLELGCLQRIADATEAMSKTHTELIRQRDLYEQWYRDERRRKKTLERRLAATQGVVTKLKNRLARTAARQGAPA